MKLQGAVTRFAPWAAREDAALREAYAEGGVEAAVAALPARSRQAIYHRAQRLKIRRRRRWGPLDDARLRQLWTGEHTVAEIAEQLGRTAVTTYHRAQQIGLPLGCPDGCEYLSTAAQRCGYDPSQIRRILAWAGVELRRPLTRPSAKRRGRRRFRPTHIVRAHDVDAAVAAWLDTEPLEAAARRLGMVAETLGRRLRAVGVTKQTTGRQHWRVSARDIERALGKQVA